MQSSYMAFSSEALAGLMRDCGASMNSVGASPLAFVLKMREKFEWRQSDVSWVCGGYSDHEGFRGGQSQNWLENW